MSTPWRPVGFQEFSFHQPRRQGTEGVEPVRAALAWTVQRGSRRVFQESQQ